MADTTLKKSLPSANLMNCVTPGAMKDTLEVKAAYLSFVKYL